MVCPGQSKNRSLFAGIPVTAGPDITRTRKRGNRHIHQAYYRGRSSGDGDIRKRLRAIDGSSKKRTAR